MTFVVRTEDGELKFGSLEELKRGYAQGLVEDGDDVRRGDGEWRKVSAMAELSGVREGGGAGALLPRGTARWYLAAAVIAVVGIAFLFLPLPPALLLVAMVGVSLALYAYVTWGAFRRRGRRGGR